MRWWEQASCHGRADLFYQVDDPDAVDQMVAVCRGCPVQVACLAEGQATNDRHTVRAGLRLWRKEERPW